MKSHHRLRFRSSSRAALAAASVLVAMAGAGCVEPTFEAVTAPPPTTVAELDSDGASIRLTRGVALAFRCTSQGGPCAIEGVESDDASVATVRRASTDGLAYGGLSGDQPEAILVVIGQGAGTTTLRVTTGDGESELSVEVLGR